VNEKHSASTYLIECKHQGDGPGSKPGLLGEKEWLRKLDTLRNFLFNLKFSLAKAHNINLRVAVAVTDKGEF